MSDFEIVIITGAAFIAGMFAGIALMCFHVSEKMRAFRKSKS